MYKYKPLTHELLSISAGDRRSQMVTRPPGQNWLVQAPCLIVFGVVYAREEVKYAERAVRYVHIEVGHAVENLCLQAVALDLGSTVMGAFKDDMVKQVIGMNRGGRAVAFAGGKGQQISTTRSLNSHSGPMGQISSSPLP